MRIGILRCDRVRSTLSAEFGEYEQMIENQLAVIDDNFDFISYHADEGLLPDDIDDCDAYIITGSRHSVFDNAELWINQLRDFVVRLYKADIKTIGICFGHEMMAEAMGGKVERADCGWQIGIHCADVINQKSYMIPSLAHIYLPMMCEDHVQSIPENATVLASSENCKYFMLQYGEHFLSLQAHPEFSKSFAKSLISVRKDEFPQKRLEKGLASFNEHEIDSSIIFQWFAHFLRMAQTNKANENIPTSTNVV